MSQKVDLPPPTIATALDFPPPKGGQTEFIYKNINMHIHRHINIYIMGEYMYIGGVIRGM